MANKINRIVKFHFLAPPNVGVLTDYSFVLDDAVSRN